MLSAGPPKAEKLLYSTLHLQTDSSFTVLNCRKRDRLGVRCFRLGRLGCRVILPGENNITARIKDIWRQLCHTSAVKSLKLGWLNTVLSLFISMETALHLYFMKAILSRRLETVKTKADDTDVESDVLYSVLSVTHELVCIDLHLNFLLTVTHYQFVTNMKQVSYNT